MKRCQHISDPPVRVRCTREQGHEGGHRYSAMEMIKHPDMSAMLTAIGEARLRGASKAEALAEVGLDINDLSETGNQLPELE